MTDQVPALQVIIPLLGAPLCALTRSARAAWLSFLLVACGALACATVLAVRVADGEVVRYAMGGWDAPVGIEYVIAPFNTPLLLLVSGIAVIVAIYSKRNLVTEIESSRIPLVYACLCLVLTGLLGITATGDAFNAFVFIEIASLSSYALIAMGRRRRALLAAFQYLIVGSIGAVFILIGIGLAYSVTGSLNMADLATRLPEIYGNRALTAAVAFVFVGLAVKMAVFPLHSWLPGAYAEAPSAVSVFLSATGTKVAIYLFIRLAFTTFGTALVFGIMPIGVIGLVLACLGMVVGSAIACFQTDLKYLLAWSSVAQIGYIVAGFSLATTAGLTASYLQMIGHSVTKGALFAAAGILVLRLGAVRLENLSGLARTMPWTFGAIVITGAGLVGLPFTAGFVAKWALATALIEQGQVLVLVAVLVSSLLAMVYVGRIVEAAWFHAPLETPTRRPVPRTMAIAMWMLVALSVYLGVDATISAGLAERAADFLLTGGE
ncbi:monovalent cation/H+ antiporter subunit D family protein [Nocardia uniformis]|uniref:Monovalent cation/H+ antiporter subunit D family protein n=1 Tax=Nocardia uniformis TaxID=53432 RepID=A0A849CH28_9NOCA|nr:monovalent cation/H+ antiporter subunit D family protein [Nocardia uniformis]NNH75179.1 monovalent cation/H+ antiporter subunit D family protein [Nocardia uniformis]